MRGVAALATGSTRIYSVLCPRQRQNSHHQKQARELTVTRSQEVDVQVFRFTLGIPGFDDANIPRVVGFLGGSLLAVNHLLSASPISDAQVLHAGNTHCTCGFRSLQAQIRYTYLSSCVQVRGEAIGALLALLLIALPSIEEELKQLGSSQGRKATAQVVSGARSLFLYNTSNENAARNLAWVSFASLRNSNTSSILVVWKGKVQIARGAFAAEVSKSDDKSAALEQFQLSMQEELQQPSFLAGLPEDGTYMPNRQAISDLNVSKLSCVAEGIQSAMLLPLSGTSGEASFMLMLSEFERALGPRDQAWLRGLSKKVRSTCEAI